MRVKIYHSYKQNSNKKSILKKEAACNFLEFIDFVFKTEISWL